MMVYPNTNVICFRMINLWYLELHSLFDFLHEQKIFRHDVLQLHLLYLCPPNSDTFPAHSLNETLIDHFLGLALKGINSISLLARSTDPRRWLCLVFPCTNFKPTHISLSSVITEFTSSLLLSLCKILEAPNMLNISSN